MTQKNESLRLLEEALKELESPKGSVLAAIQKLLRASSLMGNEQIQAWCSVQLGDRRYTLALKKLVVAVWTKEDPESPKAKKAVSEALKELDELKLKQPVHFRMDELKVKAPMSGGGYISIGFVEERYADLVRNKIGNDGTYYKNDLYSHLNYVRTRAHEFASAIYNELKFSGTISSCFDVPKHAADDKLLDLDPELAEQLMLAFKAVSGPKSEEWSQALATCRRLLEGLADRLYPPTTDAANGRPLTQAQFVNRLWAFMDKSIESESNRELAKSHVDFLGSWLERTNKVANKGVHAEVSQIEAVKAVFHTYLVVADLLEYLTSHDSPSKLSDINTATLDELEAVLGVSRATAKEIVKARVQHGKMDRVLLGKVRGVGPKTVEQAALIFSL
jgi:DNA uptake protein ComE-like DNA-binding protein